MSVEITARNDSDIVADLRALEQRLNELILEAGMAQIEFTIKKADTKHDSLAFVLLKHL